MDSKTNYELEAKLQKANRIKNSINKIDALLEDLGIFPKCVEVRMEHYGKRTSTIFSMDDEEYGTVTSCITPEALGLAKEEYTEYFTEPLINHIRELRAIKMKEYDEL